MFLKLIFQSKEEQPMKNNKKLVTGNDPQAQKYIDKLTVDPRLEGESVLEYICRISVYTDTYGGEFPRKMTTTDLSSFFAYVAVCWSEEDKIELYDNWYMFTEDNIAYTFEYNPSHLTIKSRISWLITDKRRKAAIRVETDGSYYLEDENIEVETLGEKICWYYVPENR